MRIWDFVKSHFILKMNIIEDYIFLIIVSQRKAKSNFKQGLLGDTAGSDGSLTDNINPRSLPPKIGILEDPQLPYRELGTKYTDGIESKHPTESEDFDDSSKVSTDFYPSTLH